MLNFTCQATFWLCLPCEGSCMSEVLLYMLLGFPICHPTCNKTRLLPCNLQEGNYTWPALPPFMLSNITSTTPARSMIAAPRIDVPYRHYLAAVNESCSVINSPYLAEISTCSKTTPNGYGSAEFNHGSACCYNTTGKVTPFQLFKAFWYSSTCLV